MLIIVLWFFLPQSIAEELQNRPTAQDAGVMKVPLSLLNPRVTMQTFSEAMQAVSKGDKKQLDKAISTLDLSNIASVIEKEKGKELAPHIKQDFEGIKKVDIAVWGGGVLPTNRQVTFGLLTIDGKKVLLPLKNHIKY